MLAFIDLKRIGCLSILQILSLKFSNAFVDSIGASGQRFNGTWNMFTEKEVLELFPAKFAAVSVLLIVNAHQAENEGLKMMQGLCIF